MEIITATTEHTDAVAALFNAYRVFYKQPSNLAGAAAFIGERLRNKDSVIYLARENGECIGFTQLYPLFTSIGMKKGWLLNDLFVAETHRGKGAGSALLEAARKLGAATGAGWIMLQTATGNTGAQALYERTGFKKDTGSFYYYLSL